MSTHSIHSPSASASRRNICSFLLSVNFCRPMCPRNAFCTFKAAMSCSKYWRREDTSFNCLIRFTRPLSSRRARRMRSFSTSFAVIPGLDTNLSILESTRFCSSANFILRNCSSAVFTPRMYALSPSSVCSLSCCSSRRGVPSGESSSNTSTVTLSAKLRLNSLEASIELSICRFFFGFGFVVAPSL